MSPSSAPTPDDAVRSAFTQGRTTDRAVLLDHLLLKNLQLRASEGAARDALENLLRAITNRKPSSDVEQLCRDEAIRVLRVRR
jgi:hypothetical protein